MSKKDASKKIIKVRKLMNFMKLVHIRVCIAIIATLIAICFAIGAYLFPSHSSILLTVEVILLPAVYIIGNYFAEQIIEERYQDQLAIIDKESRELRDKVITLEIENKLFKEGIKQDES